MRIQCLPNYYKILSNKHRIQQSRSSNTNLKLRRIDNWQQPNETTVPRDHSDNLNAQIAAGEHRQRNDRKKLTVRRRIDGVGLRAAFLFLRILKSEGKSRGGKVSLVACCQVGIMIRAPGVLPSLGLLDT